ncbi:MAG: hypothetical protein ACK4TK_01390 [Thiobacillaceae bacterium]
MKHLIILHFLFVFLSLPAQAHDDHGKPRWGGVVADAGEFQAELVIKAGQAKLYLSDHADMLPSQGGSGRLTLLAGGQKEELELKPVSDSALGAATTLKTARGVKAVAVIRLPGRPPAILRFTLK